MKTKMLKHVTSIVKVTDKSALVVSGPVAVSPKDVLFEVSQDKKRWRKVKRVSAKHRFVKFLINVPVGAEFGKLSWRWTED